MSANVLLNLSNELRKSEKMQGLSSILSLFHKMINKLNIQDHALDSIYHMSKLLKITILA